MNKRDRFIAELKEEAGRRNLAFRVKYRRQGRSRNGLGWHKVHNFAIARDRPKHGSKNQEAARPCRLIEEEC
jgi:hypothetical protein